MPACENDYFCCGFLLYEGQKDERRGSGMLNDLHMHKTRLRLCPI